MDLRYPIINLTQHEPTLEQKKAGVSPSSEPIKKLITFDCFPSKSDIKRRCDILAIMASEDGYDFALIGGVPFMMPQLEKSLKTYGVTPIYAFTKRIVLEKEGKKISAFKHEGFYHENPQYDKDMTGLKKIYQKGFPKIERVKKDDKIP